MPDVTVPRETSEFLPIEVNGADGTPLTEFDVALTKWPARPEAWAAAVITDEKPGIVLAGLTHGMWQAWARVSGTVIAAGSIWVD